MQQDAGVTRRSLIKGALGVMAVQLIPEGLSATLLASAEFPGITRILPSDPTFLEVLNTHFPGHSNSEAFRLMKDHMVNFKNHSGRRLWAASIHWAITSKTGAQHTLTSHYSIRSRKALSTAKGYKGQYRLRTGGRPIVTPHGYFIATPFYLCSSSSYRKAVAKRPPEAMFEKEISKRRHLVARLFRTQTPPLSSGTLFASAFENGEYYSIGNERSTNFFLKHFFSKRNAEQDEANSILKLIQKGHTHAELRRKLKRRKLAKMKPVSADHPRVYAKTRKRYAGLILRHLKKHGLPKTIALLKAVAARPQHTPQAISESQLVLSA